MGTLVYIEASGDSITLEPTYLKQWLHGACFYNLLRANLKGHSSNKLIHNWATTEQKSSVAIINNTSKKAPELN